jgi:hypothetical protein
MTSVQKWSSISSKRTHIRAIAPTIPSTSQIRTCSSKNALSDTSFGSVCSRPNQRLRRPTSCSLFLLFEFKQQQQEHLSVFRLNSPRPAYNMCCTFAVGSTLWNNILFPSPAPVAVSSNIRGSTPSGTNELHHYGKLNHESREPAMYISSFCPHSGKLLSKTLHMRTCQ